MKIIKWYNQIIEFATFLIALTAILLVIPKAFGIHPYIVESGSMEPVIHTGAVAFVDTTDTSITKGDIVTYQLPNGQMVTHRVKEETADGYIFQGDANEAADAHVITGSQIIGTYKFQIPKLGFLIGRLGKKGLFLVLGWVVALNGIGLILEHAGSTSKRDTSKRKK